MKDVDLFVIGGGSGGVRAARVAASYGAKVMLAEEHPDAGCDPGRARICRYGVRRSADCRRPRLRSDRRVLRARDRGGGYDRGRGWRLARPRRHLQDDIPADEGDAVRQQIEIVDESGGRWPSGTRRALPHGGAGCGGVDTAYREPGAIE